MANFIVILRLVMDIALTVFAIYMMITLFPILISVPLIAAYIIVVVLAEQIYEEN